MKSGKEIRTLQDVAVLQPGDVVGDTVDLHGFSSEVYETLCGRVIAWVKTPTTGPTYTWGRIKGAPRKELWRNRRTGEQFILETDGVTPFAAYPMGAHEPDDDLLTDLAMAPEDYEPNH